MSSADSVPDGSPTTPHGQPRQPLTTDDVVDTALRMIDEGGVHALSMRKLAKRLSVFPASVYWHAGTRSELLGLICEKVLNEIEMPDVDRHEWQEWVLVLGMRARRVLGTHPRFASYFVTNVQVSRASLRVADAVLGVLSEAGFRDRDLVDAYNVLLGAVFGWSAGEFAEGPEGSEQTNPQRAELERHLEDLDFPAISAHWPLVANRAYMLRWTSGATLPMDSSFELLLRTLVDGLARRLVGEDRTAR